MNPQTYFNFFSFSEVINWGDPSTFISKSILSLISLKQKKVLYKDLLLIGKEMLWITLQEELHNFVSATMQQIIRKEQDKINEKNWKIGSKTFSIVEDAEFL